MSASPPRRRFLSSWFARCRLAAGCAVFCAVPISALGQDATATTHHSHHARHSRLHHRHPASHLHAAPVKPAIVPVPVPVPAPPSPPAAVNKGSNTGLPLPRFAALRADEVNMREGPGTRYPILWLYKRRDLPVEIEREFDVWRLVEDAEGVKGWVHQATLVGTRSFVVTSSGAADAGPYATDRGAGTVLRDDPRDDAGIVAILRPGVIGRLRACPADSGWCRVTTHNYSGWLQRSAIFGLLPNAAITPP